MKRTEITMYHWHTFIWENILILVFFFKAGIVIKVCFSFFVCLFFLSLFFLSGTNNTHTPRISKKNLLNISITQNSLATFSCKQEILGAGLAGLQFDWIKWSNDISLYCSLDLDNGNFTVIDENSKFSIKPSAPDDIGNHWSYLLIHNATVHDSGLYSCVVCNQHGRDFSSAFLTVTTPSTPGL